jgi:cell division protein FtsB
MRHRRTNSKDDWILAKRSLLVANLLVFALVAWGFTGEYLRHRRLSGEIARLQAEADRLAAENFQAARLNEQFAADPAVEREARLKLGLRKPGESVIIVKDSPTGLTEPAVAETAAEAGAASPLDNLRQWWDYFFGEPEGSPS